MIQRPFDIVLTSDKILNACQAKEFLCVCFLLFFQGYCISTFLVVNYKICFIPSAAKELYGKLHYNVMDVSMVKRHQKRIMFYIKATNIAMIERTCTYIHLKTCIHTGLTKLPYRYTTAWQLGSKGLTG